ncbi:interferon omega-1-like [Haliaeetus albicilla]|uniref:interferon omega-1-like n=1 Tax=Haliaeetus albicilla TaxID=8969 RepID=UPI0037E8A176
MQVTWKLLVFITLPRHKSLEEEFNLEDGNLHVGKIDVLKCLSETTDFRFPVEITKVTQKNVTVIIYEFLQQIFQLFSKNLPVGAWNTSKIEKFQNGIHQQIEELELCLSEEQSKARSSFQTWILKSTTFSVKKYFQRITDFLKDKQYSHCSWEAVQMELRTSLSHTSILQKLGRREWVSDF